jgi:hypothetical protein
MSIEKPHSSKLGIYLVFVVEMARTWTSPSLTDTLNQR